MSAPLNPFQAPSTSSSPNDDLAKPLPVIGAPGVKDRTRFATICLHISSTIYGIVGMVCLGSSLVVDGLGRLPIATGLVGCAIALALSAGIELTAYGLRRRKYWAWVASLCVFTLYIPSLFFPLGAIGIWALVAPGTRASVGGRALRPLTNRSEASTVRSVAIRLVILTLGLIAVAVAYAHLSGVGMPPYSSVPEPSEPEKIHRLVSLALFAVATLCTAALTFPLVTSIVVRYRRRAV